jgi:sortase A
MLYPTASDMYNRWIAQEEIAQYNQVMEAEAADYSELWAAAEAYNRRLAETGTFGGSIGTEETQEVSGLLNPLGTGMMGYIDIPKINIHLPVYQGIEESALQAGAGYWLGTSLPTGGESTHCVLTAHNGLVRAKMFTDLDQMEVGDTFTLSILDRVLTYEVDQILVTEPNDLSALQIVQGEDLVTLYTCTPYGVNTHRLLVRGHRIPTPEEPEQVSPVDAVTGGLSGLERAALIALLILSLILIILAVRVIIRQVKSPPPKRLQKKQSNKQIEEERRREDDEKTDQT